MSSLIYAEFDSECRQMVAENLGSNATLHSETNPVRIEKMDSGEFTLVYKGSDGVEASIVVDAVMMATGRTPRTAGLGLEVSPLFIYYAQCLVLYKPPSIIKYSQECCVFSRLIDLCE